MKMIKLGDNVFVLFFSMLVCGLVSLYFGKDLGWDLANYHFSNPYAFLHDRLTLDYWPSSYPHAYFSPTADFLCYFLIKYFSTPLAVFLSGAIHGLNLWLLVLIARYFLPQNKYTTPSAFLIGLLGMYGPIGLTGIGDFKVDHTMSIFILAFVWLQLKALKIYSDQKILSAKFIVSAGFMLGIAIGLKLTAALFAVGTMVSFALLFSIPLRDRIKLIFMSGFAIVFGDIVASGYWMLILWKQFHNPFYPFFNNIFNHQNYVPAELREGYTRIMPHGVFKTLFYPFYFSFTGTGDGTFRDFRFLFAYVLFVVAGLNALIKKPSSATDGMSAMWLLLFFLFSYAIGQYAFASVRYMLPLEMLAPIVIYLLVKSIFKQTVFQTCIAAGILYVIALTMYPNYIVRVPEYNSDYFDVKLSDSVKQTPHAMVLLAYPAYALDLNPRPVAYLQAFLPEQWRYVGIPVRHEKLSLDASSMQHIHQLIKEYQHNNFYLLTSAPVMPELFQAAKQFGLKPDGACLEIFSSRQRVSSDTLLCRLVKDPRERVRGV